MILVANNTSIIYTDAATDPYTNADGGAMLDENQTNLDAVIGSANYDIGHVFSTGGGGVADLRVPCKASSKAHGVTGTRSPVGDGFDIDYVAHEIGHQFGARHTFNGEADNCNDETRSSVSAYEPGSGVTIMAYAGIWTTQARIKIEAAGNIFFDISDVDFAIAFPTDAPTGIGVRILNAAGRGLSRITVALSDESGLISRTTTNNFGYYRFGAVPTGKNYVVKPSYKRYIFSPQSIVRNHTNDIADLNFTASFE
jgi:hypothetical protein